MNKKYLFLSLFAVIIFFIACDKFEGEQEIPAYLKVDTILLADNPDFIEGTLNHNICDIWLYVDDQLVGAFELPALIPVLENGTHEIQINAGVKYNGMSGTRGPYPFYQPLIFDPFNFVIDSTISITPEVQYADNTVIAYYENFDDGLSSLKPTDYSDTAVLVFNNKGVIYLDSEHDKVECATNANESTGFYLPSDNSPVFLELEYSTNQVFGIGLYITTSFEIVKDPVIFINATEEDEWKKIYINLTPNINAQENILYTNIYILAEKIEDLDLAEIQLENFKLIYKNI